MTNAWNAVAKNRNRKVFIILTQKEEGVLAESEAHLEPSQTSVMELF